jgi:redox-sensing transcriptional repressor
MAQQPIPDIVIRRLPVYLRTLVHLQTQGIETISSNELGVHLGVTAAQIRRDLSYFGEFGKQGKGYNVAYLIDRIREILAVDVTWKVAVVGIGHLGEAIARYGGFARNGFEIAALFDADPSKVGKLIDGLTIMPMERLTSEIQQLDIQIAIIAVPASAAQEVADLLVEAGVRAILNYAPRVLQVPEHVRVRDIDPVAALQSMTYYLARDRYATARATLTS